MNSKNEKLMNMPWYKTHYTDVVDAVNYSSNLYSKFNYFHIENNIRMFCNNSAGWKYVKPGTSMAQFLALINDDLKNSGLGDEMFTEFVVHIPSSVIKNNAQGYSLSFNKSSILRLEIYGSDESRQFMCYVQSSNEKVTASVVKSFDSLIIFPKDKSLIKVVTVNDQGKLSLTTVTDPPVSKFRENHYSSQVVEDFNYIKDEILAEDPKGRLTIVNGPPGTGKTHLIKALINDVKDTNFILIPLKFCSSLDTPEFTKILLSIGESPLVIILEDADSTLVRRSSDNMSAISSLLNYSDGLFGAILDLRIIATTNADSLDIEPALLRNGRLSRRVHIGSLTPEQAGALYADLTGQKMVFETDTTLADVYALVKNVKTNANAGVKKKKRLGFTEDVEDMPDEVDQ